jgi:hypothetical protein
METTEQKPRIAVIRAIPMPGHHRRWGGMERWVDDTDKSVKGRRPGKHGLPWPDTEVKVAIVDEPTPFDPNMNGGVPTEISPRSLKMLMDDPRISVQMLGDASGGDPAEIVRAKAALSEQEEALQKMRRELAEAHERAKAEHQKYEYVLAGTEKRAIDASAKLTEAEAEIESLRAQLADKKGGKK